MKRKNSGFSGISSKYPLLVYGGMIAAGATLLWFLYMRPARTISGGNGFIGNLVGTVETR